MVEESNPIEIKGDKNLIEIDRKEPSAKESGQKIISFFKSKKGMLLIVGVLLLAIIILGTWIRVQNIGLLVDSTTREYLPLALDPFYFLRVAETIVENGGTLPDYDAMRYPSMKVGFSIEILPKALILMHQVAKVFNQDITLRYINVISPVIFFIFGIILFFFLIFILTRSKIIALLSSFFLAITPAYLYRTMAGFSDHEAIGMFAFFLTLLIYALSLKSLEKKEEKITKTLLFSFALSISTIFTIVSWGGGARFVFMIIPLSFIVLWGLKFKDSFNKKQAKKYLIFYFSWVLMIIILGEILVSGITMVGRLLTTSNLLVLFMLTVILVDYLRLHLTDKKIPKNKLILKYKLLASFAISIILGGIFIVVFKGEFFSYISGIVQSLLHPFGTGRVGLTVAENKQPFLVDWISQVGKTFFWLFYAGMIFVGVNISKKMKKHQDQIAFSIVWIIFISGILFSRISEGSLKNTDLEWLEGVGKLLFYLFCISLVCAGVYFRKFIKNPRIKNIFTISWVAVSFLTILVSISRSLILNNGELLINGTNLVSQLFYFGGAFLLLTVLLSIYFNEQIKIRSGLIITVSWLTFMLVSGRGAVRLFFMITPFVCFMVGYSVVNLYDYAKRSRRIKWLRVSLLSIFFIVIFAIFFSTIGYSVTHRTLCPNGISENAGQIAQIICTPDLYAQSTFQSKNTGPSANMQWQQAMSWVRENTNEGSIFIHWWDYGYWVQYLGERPTVTDGGHINSYWDHLIGRYLLTTPQPETALSLMKTHDVSYLLIDPTDLGKYGAYSSIGSGPDGNDRLSWIPTLLSDQSQMRETQNSTVRVFNGGVPLDGDIEYTKDGNTIFLPEGKAVLAGIILETTSQEGAIGLLQPEGVFIYNGNQINLPIKYIYYNGEIIEFEKGVEIILRVVTKVDIVGQNLQKDELGAIVYLSPKVAQGLFAQLYLMDDPFEKYPTLKIAHSEPDLFINHLRNQGFSLEEFVYYQGFRGPIKIWEVDYPSNIISKEEFLRVYGGWGEFDNLEFTN